jgi:hypothetical protein
MTHSLMWCALGWAGLSLVAGGSSAYGQGGITEEGDTTVFRTGSPEPLLTLSLPLLFPDSTREPSLEFEFGFGTEEVDVPASFFDSFSVTLQPADVSRTALLLTVDTTGLVRAPNNPGGLTLVGEDLDLETVTFPDLSPTLELQSAFTVSYALPSDWAEGSATLYFDLFDNQNALASLAYVRNVRIEALPPTDQPANFQVWSARVVGGPYDEQDSLVVDLTNQVVRFVPGSAKTFFLLQSQLRTRILHLSADPAEWIVSYAFEPETFLLESAEQAPGPYVLEAGVEIDVGAQTMRLPTSNSTRFYRIQSEAAVTLTDSYIVKGELILEYRFAPLPVVLWSATTAAGPYLPETAARQNTSARTIRIQRGGSTRFFRITADRALRLRDLAIENGQVTLGFEQP